MNIEPGAVRVNVGDVLRAGDGIVALEIDLHSKYASVACSGGGSDSAPLVMLEATPDTLKLDPEHPRDALTTITFPDYPGWDVHSYCCGRYTLSVCLVRRD